MAEIIFNFQGSEKIIQCKTNEKFNEIFNKFAKEIGININTIYFLYQSKNISENLTFNQLANSQDLKRNKMNIYVYQKLIKSKEIICPECGENIRIKFKDYKISLDECKNKHIINNLFLNEFENTQNIDSSKIFCDKCQLNINNLYNIKLYKCYPCGMNICRLCKYNHDKNHNIINYNKKNFKCNIHNETFNSFCDKCKKNLCFLCEKGHENHDIIYYKDIMPNQDQLYNEINELNIKIEAFCQEINDIILKLNKVVQNFDIYYKIIYNIEKLSSIKKYK